MVLFIPYKEFDEKQLPPSHLPLQQHAMPVPCRLPSSPEALATAEGTGNGCSCWAEESGGFLRETRETRQTRPVGQRLGHNPPAPDTAVPAGLAPGAGRADGATDPSCASGSGAMAAGRGPEAVTCCSVFGLPAQSPCAKSIYRRKLLNY